MKRQCNVWNFVGRRSSLLPLIAAAAEAAASEAVGSTGKQKPHGHTSNTRSNQQISGNLSDSVCLDRCSFEMRASRALGNQKALLNFTNFSV